MKNLKIFALAAFALLGFAACQQEELVPQKTTHTVTFVAGAPETTKTTVDIEDGITAKFAWTAADAGRFAVYENGTKAKKTDGALGEDGKMTLTATFDGTAAGDKSYIAVVNTSNTGQIMSSLAYDEDADILVSKATTAFDGGNGTLLQFKREVAIAKMTLKGLDENEVVNQITVSSNADIAGKYGVDGWNTTKTSLIVYSAVAMGEEAGYSIVANASGEAVVWFTCIPQDATTLTVKVEAADGDTYTKEFGNPITLSRGDVKPFGVAMEKDAPKTYGYQKISSVEEYAPGDYIIVAHAYKDDCPTKGDFAIENTLSISGGKLLGKVVTSIIDNDVIYASDGATYKLSLSGDKDNVSISNGTNKLGWGSSTNLKLDENTTWSLSLNEGDGGTFILLNNAITSGTQRALLFQVYTTSGESKTESLKFGPYAVSNINDAPYAAIELYKYQEVTPPTPKFSIALADVPGGTLSASSASAEEGAEILLTATPDEGYAFNNVWTVKDADGTAITVTDGKFNMPAKNVTVSGSFSKVDYTITKATCEGGSFTVKKDGEEVTKAQVGDAITLEASAAPGYEFDSWTVTNESTSKTVYVSENSFTMPGANVTVSANFLNADVIPVYASVADLIKKVGAPTSEGAYVTVTLTNEEITKFYTTSAKARRGVYFTVGTQEIELFGDIACPEEWVAGGWVSGTLTKCKWMEYKGTWELCPTDWTELTYAAPCETPVITLDGASATIECATVGATIRYTTDGTDPNETSTEYTDAVTLTDGQTIKAKAFLDGHKPSDIASKKYTAGSTDENTPAVGTVLWSESFGDWGGAATNFSNLTSTISTYTYTGRSGYLNNENVTLTSSSDNVKGATSSGANMTSGHLWFNKSTEASVTTSDILLYGTTKVTLSFAQGGSGSSITSSYSTNGGSTWTELGSTSGPNARYSYTISVNSDVTSISLRFTHKSSNGKNTRVDDFSLIVAE